MEQRSRDTMAAFVASVLGVIAGAATYAATGTAKVLLSPGLDAASPVGWLFGPFLVFAGGFFWGLVGGALFTLVPVFLVFRHRPRNTLATALVLTLVLVTPLAALGLRGRVVDGALLAFSIWVGVRTGLGRLARGTGRT